MTEWVQPMTLRPGDQIYPHTPMSGEVMDVERCGNDWDVMLRYGRMTVILEEFEPVVPVIRAEDG